LNLPPRLHHRHFCGRLNCRFQIATLLHGYVLGHRCRESLTTRERDFSLAALSILGWPISCCGKLSYMICFKLSSGGARNPPDCSAPCSLVAVVVREHFH